MVMRRGDADERLRCALRGVLRQHLVDQRLVADATAPRFLAELFEYVRVHPDGNELPRGIAKRGPAHALHGAQLLV